MNLALQSFYWRHRYQLHRGYMDPTASLDILDTTKLPCFSWESNYDPSVAQPVIHAQYLFISLYGRTLFYYKVLLLRITLLTEMLR